MSRIRKLFYSIEKKFDTEFFLFGNASEFDACQSSFGFVLFSLNFVLNILFLVFDHALNVISCIILISSADAETTSFEYFK